MERGESFVERALIEMGAKPFCQLPVESGDITRLAEFEGYILALTADDTIYVVGRDGAIVHSFKRQ